MKGSNKQFAKYLDSEYNEYYLEPHTRELEKNYLILKNNHQSSSPGKTTEPIHKISPIKPFKNTAEMVPLTNDIIEEFVSLLSQEAVDYFTNLIAIERVNAEVSEAYKEFYTKFQTIPILFLSHVPEGGVYLWQVNRLCSYKKKEGEANHMILDSKAMKSDVKLHPNISILLLAKIAAEEDEEIMTADFAGRSQICVRSCIGREQEVTRSYRIKDFVETARINPYKQEILANDKYSYKIVMKKLVIDGVKSDQLEVSLWNKKTAEEIQKEMIAAVVSREEEQGEAKPVIMKDKLVQVDESLNSDIFSNLRTSEIQIYGTQKGVAMLLDWENSNLVAWGGDILIVKHFDIKYITEATVHDNKLFMKVSGGQVWYLDFDTPHEKIKNNLYVESDIFDKLGVSKGFRSDIQFNRTKGKPCYRDSENLVYDTPVSVINPYAEKIETQAKINEKRGEEEKQDEGKLPKTVDKIRSEFKQQKNAKVDNKEEFESTKEIMGEIRIDIRSKKSELKKLEDEKDKQKEKDGHREKEIMTKEAMELYQEVKMQKKRMEKEREKEKNKRKNGASNRDEF